MVNQASTTERGISMSTKVRIISQLTIDNYRIMTIFVAFKNKNTKNMKRRFLIVALFTLFLGGIAVAQSQEQPSTLAELQAEKERLEAKLAKVLEDKENAENSLVGKYQDVAFAFNRYISKKQRKFAKTVERGAKRQEKQIKKKLKKINKRIEKMSQLEN